MGRPIAYRGDPNSPALTEDERRRVKRRIANRESARRVRQKRQDQLGELQIKVGYFLRLCAEWPPLHFSPYLPTFTCAKGPSLSKVP